MKPPAKRLKRIAPQFFSSLNEKVAALKNSGCDVIRLDIGSPDLPPPREILAALAASASRDNHHGYQAHSATPALRQAWAHTYLRLYGVQLDPGNEVVPLLGSKEGIFHLMLAMVDPGDIVLIPDPGYLTYTHGAVLAGGEPYYLPLNADNQYLPDLDSIPPEVAHRAKLLWLNYPNNPTAATAPLAFFEKAIEFARRFEVLVCHDAAYAQVAFDDYRAPSLLEVPGASEIAIEFNTLSKSHNMAGWRTGAALGNSQALRALHTLKTHADSGHFLPILDAAAAALNGDQSWLGARNRIYQERRDAAVKGLHAVGLDAKVPSASLYVWSPNPSGWTAQDFSAALLEKAHVSVTPGTVFGAQGEGYFRIALTTGVERVEQAMQRIANSGLV
jgi:LL-diaminopimelate aminotransferase